MDFFGLGITFSQTKKEKLPLNHPQLSKIGVRKICYATVSSYRIFRTLSKDYLYQRSEGPTGRQCNGRHLSKTAQLANLYSLLQSVQLHDALIYIIVHHCIEIFSIIYIPLSKPVYYIYINIVSYSTRCPVEQRRDQSISPSLCSHPVLLSNVLQDSLGLEYRDTVYYEVRKCQMDYIFFQTFSIDS